MSSFPRKFRLSKSDQYQAVYQEKKKWVTRSLIFYIKRNKLNHLRLGLSVPKRTIRSAVGRNRVKRINREHLRFRQEKLVGFDIVVVTKKEINGIKYDELFECLGQQWDYFLNYFRKL